MSNVRNDRATTRWPSGVVPYVVSETVGQTGRAQIAAAMANWTGTTRCTFVERTDEVDFVMFHGDEDECASTEVGRAGGQQQVGCEYPLTPRMQAGAPLAIAAQGQDGQLDCVFVGTDGAVYVMWTVGSSWTDPVGLTPPGTAPAGAPIALAHQVDDNQLDAVFVDVHGAVNVMWVQGGGAWQGPVALTSASIAPAGAPIALAHQVDDNQLDAVFVDVHGAVNVMWVQGGGAWQGPVALTSAGIAPAGAAVALHHQVDDNQLDAVFVDGNGVVTVMWVVGGGAWQGPVGLTASGAAVAGAAVTLFYQGGRSDQLDALFVDGSGVVTVMWVAGGGAWQGPVGLSGAGAAPAGAPVAVGEHAGGTELEALIAGAGNVPIVGQVSGLEPWSGFSPIDGSGWGVRAITHELGHVLGLFHEQQRADRGSFLTYHPDRVRPGKEHNFDIPAAAVPLGPYDYASIMHYGPGAFARPGAGPTLEPPAGVMLGSAAPTAEDVLAVRYAYGQVAAPGTRLAAGYQGSPQQLSVVFPDALEGVSVMWVSGNGTWQPPIQLALPAGGVSPATQISMHDQGGLAQQLDAVFIDDAGAVNVMWVHAADAWQGPVALTPPGTAPAGTPVALHHQVNDDQLDALFVDGNGVVTVMWVVGGGAWQGPVGLTPPGAAPAGAPIALHHQAGDQQLTAMFVDGSGVVTVMWVVGGGAWQGPVGLTPQGTAPAGAPIALSYQVDSNQLTAVFVGVNGAVNVMWVVGGGAWQGPVGLTPPGTAPAGTAIALSHQVDDNQLTAVFVDGDGVVTVMWVVGGGAWQGPVGLTRPGAAPSGAPVTLHHQVDDGQLDALFVDGDGVVTVMWVQGGGAWQGPAGVS